MRSSGHLLVLTAFASLTDAACIPNTTTQAGLQEALQKGGPGYVQSLCPGQIYEVTQVLKFTAADQEISTEGYPIDGSRATLFMKGPSTCAVKGDGLDLDRVKLRNVQIDGNRIGNPATPSPNEGGNIEMGGNNAGQIIEYVRTFNPRGWTCLHIMEGELKCSNSTVQHNDIGPCGHDTWGDWADGISLSCSNSTVYNNTITDATDGGIVIFGAPFSVVRDNHIRVVTRTMLGGINLVDSLPWKPAGNFSGTRVLNNRIEGGYATAYGDHERGPQNASALIKIGIGLGPRVWWSKDTFQNTSRGGEVSGNVLSGAFTFGMAVASTQNFVITNNSFVGNATFIGNYGENCTQWPETPHPPVPLLRERGTIKDVAITKGAANGPRTDWDWEDGTVQGLTCFVPPKPEEWAWPYGGGGVNAEPTGTGAGAGASPSSPGGKDSGGSSVTRDSVRVGGVLAAIVLSLLALHTSSHLYFLVMLE